MKAENQMTRVKRVIGEKRGKRTGLSLVMLLCLSLQALAFIPALIPAQVSAAPFDHQHRLWDQLLQQHVYWLPDGHASQFDYRAVMEGESRASLDRYLAQLSQVAEGDYRRWSKPQQLAFLINAYNAYTVQLVLSKYPHLESIRELGSFIRPVWKKRFFILRGKQRSLDELEHKLIRAEFNEPRVHFALNCASVGCPALGDSAYTADKLEPMLEQATRRFLSDHRRNRYSPAQQQLSLSRIFDWYEEDFLPSVPRWLGRYATELGGSEQQVTAAEKPEYLPYDWSLNHRP